MSELEELARRIRLELAPDYEARLRAALDDKDKAWLIDQLVRQFVERDVGPVVSSSDTSQAIDEADIHDFIERHVATGRDGLVVEGARPAGTALLAREDRTDTGQGVLHEARSMLSALLFGDAASGVLLDRVQQELLTIVLPRAKADALDFLRASTELSAVGTWHDPQDVSNDERADNVVLEVQFGEVASEIVGRGIMTALRLINELEVNEQVLYARMVNVEETSLP